MRFTPASASARSLGGVTLLGAHSKVTSHPLAQGRTRFSPPNSLRMLWAVNSDGVPPPK